MLGRFLEYSVPTSDIQASLDFYRRLNFSQAVVGDAWPHPYAVVTDGRLCLGLHQAELAPTITFVRPELIKFLAQAESAKLAIDYRKLGSHVFNEIGLQDPDGHAVRVVEARSFSPSSRGATEFSACGYFEEIALPGANLERGKVFWETCGFVGIDELEALLPHVSCTSDAIDVGLYETKLLQRPSLVFAHANLAALLETANAAGIEPARQAPARLTRQQAVLFTAPEGTELLVLNDAS